MKDRAFYISAALVLALALGLHLFFLSRGFYSISWDEAGRTLDAHAWATHGVVMGNAWLPFYRVCVGLALRIHPDLVVTPRLVSLLFGLGSLVAVGWLADELFRDRRTTLLTITLGALLPQRIALTLAPLSDIMFMTAMLATMALLARWLRTDDRSALRWCALTGLLATTIRYEGWIFAAVLWLVVWSRSRLTDQGTRRDLLVFGATLFLFATGWSVSTFLVTNPIAVVIADARQFTLGQVLRKNPLVEFVLSNGLSLNLIGALAIVHFVRRDRSAYRTVIAASFAPLVLVSLLLLLTRSAQTGLSWRMTGVWSMLLLPFTAWVLATRLSASAERKVSPALTIGATALVLAAFLHSAFRIETDSSTWAFPKFDRLAGQYLNEWISAKPDRKILIESSLYAYLNLQVASQHPDAFVKNSIPERESVPILAPSGRIGETLDERGIGLLVFRSDQYIAFLDRSPEVTKLEQFGDWSIYQPTNPDQVRP